jgi:trehalose synthase-fused probable maltokinase
LASTRIPSGLSFVEQGFWAEAKAEFELAMPSFLMEQRWYPAKDAGEPLVIARELFPFACPIPAAVAIWDVRPPRGDSLRMFVPVAAVRQDDAAASQMIARIHVGGAGYDFVEAFSRDEFVRSWMKYQLGGSQFPTPPRDLHAGRTDQWQDIDPATAEIRRSQVEQSNTSLRIGEHAIMKVIRKLETGPHPELEVGRFLSEAGFSATPALLGWTELDIGNQRCTLSLLHQFVENSGDGWSWSLQKLDRAISSHDAKALDVLAGWIRRLAIRTAEMHRAFAAETDDPAFCPETVTAEDFAHWRSSAEGMARRALEAIGSYAARDGRRSDPALELLQRCDAVLQHIRRLMELPESFSKTRHHGDLHLGQVLVADGDAMILDFEGEPLRPLPERRAKHCIMRDVAGILRSLSYAAATAARSAPEAMREESTAMLEQWRLRASRDFVECWLAAAQGISSIPESRDQANALLDFFLLEKALYEISYEAAHRPDWIEIPLQGVISLLR